LLSHRAYVSSDDAPAVVVVVESGAGIMQPYGERRGGGCALRCAEKPGDAGALVDEHGQVFFD